MPVIGIMYLRIFSDGKYKEHTKYSGIISDELHNGGDVLDIQSIHLELFLGNADQYIVYSIKTV